MKKASTLIHTEKTTYMSQYNTVVEFSMLPDLSHHSYWHWI